MYIKHAISLEPTVAGAVNAGGAGNLHFCLVALAVGGIDLAAVVVLAVPCVGGSAIAAGHGAGPGKPS